MTTRCRIVKVWLKSKEKPIQVGKKLQLDWHTTKLTNTYSNRKEIRKYRLTYSWKINRRRTNRQNYIKTNGEKR